MWKYGRIGSDCDRVEVALRSGRSQNESLAFGDTAIIWIESKISPFKISPFKIALTRISTAGGTRGTHWSYT